MDQDLSLLVYLCYKYVGKLILYKKIKIKIKTNIFLGQLNICMNLNRLLVLLIFVLKITYLSPIVSFVDFCFENNVFIPHSQSILNWIQEDLLIESLSIGY